jgi:hypothetical protein
VLVPTISGAFTGPVPETGPPINKAAGRFLSVGSLGRGPAGSGCEGEPGGPGKSPGPGSAELAVELAAVEKPRHPTTLAGGLVAIASYVLRFRKFGGRLV